MNIGELNHSNESEFQSYVAKELSEDDLNRMIVKPSTSCDENNSIENLYTSSNSHFVPIRMARRLFTKKIDVKSIEKHASAGEVEIAVPISPPPVSSNFSMKLPASQGNSSQSLCSNFTEHLMNNCAHNLVTACTICSENVETATNKEEIENVLVDRDLPIEMFIKSKTNKINDPIDILGWVENSVYLTNERKLAMQMFDDLEAKVALTKDMWNEGQPDVLPEQDDSDFFNSKLDKAFNDLITIKSNYPTRQMPVELNQDVVYNSFQDLKQKAERRFEMRHKGIYIPHDYVFDAVPITNNEIFDTPAEAKTDDVSNAKFFPQNKNIKFFKSNQNTFSQRCNNSTGFFPR